MVPNEHPHWHALSGKLLVPSTESQFTAPKKVISEL
jgi:hypothetical protein